MGVTIYEEATESLRKEIAELKRENERLKKELAETKEALKPIDDAYIPDYDICYGCPNVLCGERASGVTCECYNYFEAVRKAQNIIGGWSWTRITEKD